MKDERTFKIIGAAMEVHRELGCGFLEAVYQEALAIEFKMQEMPYKQQQFIEIMYKEKPRRKSTSRIFCVIMKLFHIEVLLKLQKSNLC